MSSTIFDSIKSQQASSATTGSTLVPFTALSLCLAVACHSSSSPIHANQRPLQEGRTVGTLTRPSVRHITHVSEFDLVSELARVYDELIVSQIEMDPDVRRAIYTDLRGLYE